MLIWTLRVLFLLYWRTRVDCIRIIFHPFGHSESSEERKSENEQISGRIEINVLQAGYTHSNNEPYEMNKN